MTGAMSRRKGAQFEREIAKRILLRIGVDLRRDLSQYQSKGKGDLVTGDPAWPFVIECKHRNRSDLPSWRRQAITAAEGTGKDPCIIYRITGGPVRVQVPMSAMCRAWPSAEWVEMTLDGFCLIAAERMAAPGSWVPNDLTDLHRRIVGGGAE